MKIIGLDPAVNMGFAVGAPGERPESFSVRLKREREDAAVAYMNCLAFMVDMVKKHAPDAIVRERMFSLAAFRDKGAAAAAVETMFGFHAIILAVAGRYGIPCHDVAAETARKHFLDRGRFGSRVETKQAVIRRCRALGYVPADCADDNRCDACCVWDWATVYIARKPPRELHLFGER